MKSTKTEGALAKSFRFLVGLILLLASWFGYRSLQPPPVSKSTVAQSIDPDGLDEAALSTIEACLDIKIESAGPVSLQRLSNILAPSTSLQMTVAKLEVRSPENEIWLLEFKGKTAKVMKKNSKGEFVLAKPPSQFVNARTLPELLFLASQIGEVLHTEKHFRQQLGKNLELISIEYDQIIVNTQITNGSKHSNINCELMRDESDQPDHVNCHCSTGT